jgi:hypothetical protein
VLGCLPGIISASSKALYYIKGVENGLTSLMYVLGRNLPMCVLYRGFHFDPELGSRGPNVAINYLNHTPFGLRPLQLVVRGGARR